MLSHYFKRGEVAWLVVCQLRNAADPRLTLASGTFYYGKILPPFANSRRAHCKLLGERMGT